MKVNNKYSYIIVERNSYGRPLLNWDWKVLNLEGISLFKDVKCHVGYSGNFYRIGDLFNSACEAIKEYNRYNGKY